VRDARLARLSAERTRFDSTTGLDRCTHRAWNTVCDLVRDGLVQAGIDPESATAVQLSGMAVHMAEFGDMLEGRRLEEQLTVGDHDGLACSRRKSQMSRDVSGTDTGPIRLCLAGGAIRLVRGTERVLQRMSFSGKPPWYPIDDGGGLIQRGLG
jgi:hypothetical protein